MTHRQGANPPGADKEGKASLRLERAMESLPAESQPRLEPSGELDALAKAVIGAAIEVHRHLGPGYLESAYEEAMAIEFRLRGIPFERQAAVPIIYKGHDIGEGRVDFLARDWSSN